ncbi:MAG: hypothetical protein ACRCTA_00925 [Bacilli bacterium]
MNKIFDTNQYQSFLDLVYNQKSTHLKQIIDGLTLVVKDYYILVDSLDHKDKASEKQKALAKIVNHTFSLAFESISSFQYDHFNSLFRLSRSILENKIFTEFISENSEQQAYWYNNWYMIKQANKLDEKELRSLYPKEEDYIKVNNLYNSFIKQHHKIYSNDYGFAQNTLKDGYITLREITLSTSQSDYDYYKYFSDLSHSSNEASNLMEHRITYNEVFTSALTIRIIAFIKECLLVQIKRLNEYFLLNKEEYQRVLSSISMLESLIKEV